MFQDQVVVITGASSGIGLAIARDMLVAGATVIISSDNLTRLDSALTALRKKSPKVSAIACDVRNQEQIEVLAKQVLEQHTSVDILINNAGYAVYRSFEESSTAEVLDILDVNLAGAMRFTKVFLPKMIERMQGRIVNISSIGGEAIITPNAAYCAAKHGMVAWSKAIRYELARFHIKVNVVCPGHTTTHFHDHITFRRRELYRRRSARSLTADQVSAAVSDAIRRDRVVTYVPWWQSGVVWVLGAIPFVSEPMWNRLTSRRIDQLYEQIERERQNGTN